MLVSYTAVTFLSGDFTPKYGGCLNRLAVAITGSGLRSRQFVLSASRLQDYERRWFYHDFDVARSFRLFVFARPNFIIEVMRRVFPNDVYLSEHMKQQLEFN